MAIDMQDQQGIEAQIDRNSNPFYVSRASGREVPAVSVLSTIDCIGCRRLCSQKDVQSLVAGSIVEQVSPDTGIVLYTLWN